METLHVAIQRSDGTTSDYEVKYKKDNTVLNIVDEIYAHHDPTLAYRYSCSTGLCATCTMMINKKPGLSCMKIAEPGEDGILSLAPLPRGNTVKDLMKEM